MTDKFDPDRLFETMGKASAPTPDKQAKADAMRNAMAVFDAVISEADASLEQKTSQRSQQQARQTIRKRGPGMFSRFRIWLEDFTMEYRKQLLLTTAASVSFMLVGVTLMMQDNNQVSTGAQLSAVPDVQSIPGELGSPYYESLMSDFNQRESQRALVEGRGFVPVLQGQLQIDNDISLPLPPASAPAQVADAIELQRQGAPKPRLEAERLERSRVASKLAEAEVDASALPLPSEFGLSMNSNQGGNLTGLAAPADTRVMADRIAGSPPVLAEPMPVVPKEMIGRDRFDDIEINPTKQVGAEPVSTFSIDVDTAAYSFIRRQLNEGYLPQKDAVRIEEMINYFDYDYPLPEEANVPFEPSVAVFDTPWNSNTQLVHIGIKGYDLPAGERPRANLTFLVDTSGSMSGPDRLPLLQQSLRMLVEEMNPDDTIAIAAYAGSAGVVLEPTPVSEKRKILAAINNMQSGGSTAGAAGIRLAYDLTRQNFDKDAVNRVILGTDGDFNVGIANSEELKGFVERQRESGIYLSVLGFGEGNYNDTMMQALAQNGNGVATYIDTLQEARKVLVEEANSTLFTIAKDVKIQVEFNPAQVSEYRLIGYESRMLNREDFNNDKVDAGEIGAGHAVTALYEILPVNAVAGNRYDPLRYGDAGQAGSAAAGASAEPVAGDAGDSASTASNEIAFLKMRYKLPDEDTSRLITRPITADDVQSADAVSDDSRFAVAVAGFGQLLRGGRFLGSDYDYDAVIDMANGAKGTDEFGQRAEFVQLVRQAKTAAGMR